MKNIITMMYNKNEIKPLLTECSAEWSFRLVGTVSSSALRTVQHLATRGASVAQERVVDWWKLVAALVPVE